MCIRDSTGPMKATALVNATVLTGESVCANSSVVIEDGSIAGVVIGGRPASGRMTEIDVQGRRLVPGLIDIQVNGGGGVLFNDSPTVDALRTIGEAHARLGTTGFLPTLISDDDDVMRAAIDAVRRALRERVPGVLGLHLEGPHLNPRRHGAHDAGKFRKVDAEAMELLTSLGRGAVTLVTLAPEMTSTEVIEQLSSAGVIVFAGHAEADYEQCRRAVEVGLGGFTHLFNAMPPMMGRAPGMVGAALDLDDAVFSVIADGHHVHPASLRVALAAKKRGQVVLVSDAMPTVGSTLTDFRLGGERVELKDGMLRNRRGSLAGSHLNMLEAVRNTIALTGVHWTEAVRMASGYPARTIGLADRRGYVARGCRADLLELDEDMTLHRMWVAGEPSKHDFCHGLLDGGFRSSFAIRSSS